MFSLHGNAPRAQRGRRHSQDHIAVAFAGAAHMAEPVDKLAVEQDPNEAVGTGRGGASPSVEAIS